MAYRTVGANDWIARRPKTVQEAGEELIREVTLRRVREAVKRTQVEVAAAMGTSQDRVHAGASADLRLLSLPLARTCRELHEDWGQGTLVEGRIVFRR